MKKKVAIKPIIKAEKPIEIISNDMIFKSEYQNHIVIFDGTMHKFNNYLLFVADCPVELEDHLLSIKQIRVK